MIPDPRAASFNYGVGWGSAPKPPIFLEAMKLAHKLAVEAIDASHRAWDVEMAIRDVRLAETGAEKAKALLILSVVMDKYRPQELVAAE